MPRQAWKDIGSRTWTRTWEDNVGLVSAGVAYYGFLAVVPMLGLVVLAYGLAADSATVIANMRMLTGIFPPDVADLIRQQLLGVVESSRETKGVGIAVALAVALYGATNGAGSIMTALNIAYEEQEKRSLLRFYMTALAITFAAVIVAVVALAGTTAVAFLGRLAPDASPVLVAGGRALAYLLLVIVAAAVAASLYRYGPSRQKARWRWITPGSLFASIAWLMLTTAFGFYVSKITDYSATYGSLGTVIVLLTWIYLSAYALLFGAELNSEIEHQTSRDSTTGKPLPMGRRGAWAADHVAHDDKPEPPEKRPSMAEATPDAPNRKKNQKKK